MSTAIMTAIQQGLQSCEGCGLLSRPAPGAEEGRCPRCGEELRFRKRDSLQRTLAFLIAAAICYIPANLLPVMTTITASGEESDTILQGVVLLWSPTGWPLSLIVLFASIMIPSAKILALLYLVFTVRRGSIENNRQRVRLYRIVDIIGRWSMVDVFVDTFTVALIQLQPLMSVKPAPGVLFFAAVVVLTMLAVESFDPRLIWDPCKFKKRSNMPDNDNTIPQAPEAKIVTKKRTRLSFVWIFPLVAAVAGVWVAVNKIRSEGPKITIVFRSAEGLEAGKTKIRYNGVDVGTVTAFRLTAGPSARDRHGEDGAQDRRFSRQRHQVLGRAAADLRRERHRVGHPDLRRLPRHGDWPVVGTQSATSSRWRWRRWWRATLPAASLC